MSTDLHEAMAERGDGADSDSDSEPAAPGLTPTPPGALSRRVLLHRAAYLGATLGIGGEILGMLGCREERDSRAGSGTRRVETLSPTALRALDAYGGPKRWQSATWVSAVLSFGGLAFDSKGVAGRSDMAVAVDLERPVARLATITPAGEVGVLDGETVRLESSGGDVVSRRRAPRQRLLRERPQPWDALDLTYFCGYAIWNYLAFPRLLLRPDIGWSEPEPGVLDATFPSTLPTHSAAQRFAFDATTGLLRQHDYTAEVVFENATAAHVIPAHRTLDGLPVAASRKVFPRNADGTAAAEPVLVWIEIHDWKLT